jgi:DNA-binding response OmpR family regulator
MIDETTARILVVDDDLPITMFLQELLQDEGYDVKSLHRGQDVLDGVTQYEPDVVLLDVNLPDMSGYEVCRQLAASAATSDLPILLMSGIDRDPNAMAHGLNLGGFDFIVKPFHNDELLARVRVLVRLRRLQQRLVEQERMRVMVETAGAMCHELGQPLSAASGLIQLMLVEGKFGPEQLADLESLNEAVQRMIEIVRNGQSVQNYATKPYLAETGARILDLKRAQGGEAMVSEVDRGEE